MTGHVDIWDDANQKAACQVIRDYCIANNKVLFDFADIEHHNPDGVYFPFVDDNCGIYTRAGGTLSGNWATSWQNSHTVGRDWYSCNSAHSQPLNANQKAYAAWALWCTLAANINQEPPMTVPTLTEWGLIIMAILVVAWVARQRTTGLQAR
jgi:hypothetical protein